VFFRVSGAAFCRGPRCVCLPGRLTGVGVEKKGGVKCPGAGGIATYEPRRMTVAVAIAAGRYGVRDR